MKKWLRAFVEIVRIQSKVINKRATLDSQRDSVGFRAV